MLFKGGPSVTSVFALLSGRRFLDANLEARSAGAHRLATLAAQCGPATGGGGSGLTPFVRQLLRQQLAAWQNTEADTFIDPETLRVYALLAGHMTWRTSNGDVINVCNDVEWRRAFAVHLWFACAPTAGISDAMRSYDAAFSGCGDTTPYAQAPLPAYIEEDEERREVKREWGVRSVCYHLLKLYCDRTHQLNSLLDPKTHTVNALDYRLRYDCNHIFHYSLLKLQPPKLWRDSRKCIISKRDQFSDICLQLDVVVNSSVPRVLAPV